MFDGRVVAVGGGSISHVMASACAHRCNNKTQALRVACCPLVSSSTLELCVAAENCCDVVLRPALSRALSISLAAGRAGHLCSPARWKRDQTPRVALGKRRVLGGGNKGPAFLHPRVGSVANLQAQLQVVLGAEVGENTSFLFRRVFGQFLKPTGCTCPVM